MGNSRWSESDWKSYSRSTSAKPREEIFTKRGMQEALDPAKIKFREAVDSAANPNSTPIIIACDCTGSMGTLAETIIKHGLGVVFKSIYTHKPVSDPQICCMATGDGTCDEAPLQVTQFEASVAPLTQQIEDIWLEGNGGGNGGESYALAWWFAAYRVKTDCFAKRSRRGYLFTIGDECQLPVIAKREIQKVMGAGCELDIPVADLLKIVQQHWHVYHLMVKPVETQPVVDSWRRLLGERAVTIRNHEKLAETIVTIISINEGVNADRVTEEFDHDTKLQVRESTKHLLAAGA